MTISDMIGKIYDRLSKQDLSGAHDKLAVQVNLTGDDGGVFYIEVLNGVPSVMPYEYIDHDAIITTTTQILEKILVGNMEISVAFAEGKIKIEGDVDKVLTLDALLHQ